MVFCFSLQFIVVILKKALITTIWGFIQTVLEISLDFILRTKLSIRTVIHRWEEDNLKINNFNC